VSTQSNGWIYFLLNIYHYFCDFLLDGFDFIFDSDKIVLMYKTGGFLGILPNIASAIAWTGVCCTLLILVVRFTINKTQDHGK
jgi:hypothetical protein